jgi:hypothetical protein
MKSTALLSAVLALAMSSVASAQEAQLGTYLHGTWTIKGKAQGEEVKGRMTVRPAAEGHSQFYRWTLNYPDEVRHGSAIGGIDSASGKVVEHAIGHETHWTNTYDQILADDVAKTTGTRVGTVRGEPYEGRITVDRTSKDRFVYKVESDEGVDVDFVFERLTPEADGEGAFKAFAELAVGGTWVAEIDGERFENTYEWFLDEQFLRLTAKAAGDFSESVEILGVDPKTGKFTSWRFSASGMVSMGTIRQIKDGVWVGLGGGKGPKGSVSSRDRVTKINDNTVRYEILEQNIDGDVPEFTEVSTWKRKQ